MPLRLLAALVLCLLLVDTILADDQRQTLRPHARLRPAARADVTIEGGFFGPIRDRSRDVGVPDYLKKFEEHGYIDNFRLIAKDAEAVHVGGPNNDEFVHKHLEALGYYCNETDQASRLFNELADTILAAQKPDGYLNTFYEAPLLKAKGLKRFQPRNRFEFYNFGHFTQAAIAHWRSTGDERVLKAAVRFADLIVERFADPGDLPYDTYRGPVNQKYEHPNHELAMVELYRVTGDRRYLEFARQTLEEYEFFGPKFEQIWGHAVQETLLYAGATDLYLETGDEDIWNVVERLWHDMAERKSYIIGGVGSTNHGEAYGEPFELPNDSAYCETCAAISLVFWNHKMLLATGDPKYAEWMERSLYNNVLSGISLSGTEYFYPNVLKFRPENPRRPGTRSGWFGCSCCPPNVHRFLGSLDSYIYTAHQDEIGVQLFIDSTLRHTLPCAAILTLRQETDYPRSEEVVLRVGLDQPAEAVISVRVPGWCERLGISINDKPVRIANGAKSVELRRRWLDGDVVRLRLPMPVRIVAGDERVASQKGRVALFRGPVVYCLEGHDNPNVDLDEIVVPQDFQGTPERRDDLLNGVVTIQGNARAVDAERDPTREVEITAIPYYTWANRGPAKMDVWLAADPSLLPKPKAPTIASRSRVTASFWNKGQANLSPNAVNDQAENASSKGRGVLWFHWWPHKGTNEWVQYYFESPATITSVDVYWFDDTGRGNCRVPQSWRVLYRADDGSWRPVDRPGSYGVEKDQFNRVQFEQVKTSALRLDVQLQDKFSSGVLEWVVGAAE